MHVVHDLKDVDLSRPIAFVPTMGALHAGHSALITQARKFSDSVIVSVFVNPHQFEYPNDFAKYPRSPENDFAMAQDAGATVMWTPTEEMLYPEGFEVLASPTSGEKFEGVHRKGHFGGVLTAVNALFNAVKPTWAIFGEKDFQQLFLVRQMVAERHMNIEIVATPTVRDPDGLALSSRNLRLSQSDREVSLVIGKALSKAITMSSLSEARFSLVKTLSQEPGFLLDYAAIIDEDTFELASEQTPHKRALVAGWVNGVRLIDNMAMTSVGQ